MKGIATRLEGEPGYRGGAARSRGRGVLELAGGALLILSGCRGSLPPEEAPRERWYKGNTHAHTLWDNGDARPEVVVQWYRSHGYHFLALSDHNEKNALSESEQWSEIPGEGCFCLKTLSELRASLEVPGQFILLPGEEIGDVHGNALVHHNVINLERLLPPPGGISLRDVMARAVEAGDGESTRTGRPVLVHLNHPNLGWAIGASDIAAVTRESFFEVYSGHPVARSEGDASHASTERMWDQALTARLRSGAGSMIYAVAADDAHHYSGKGPAHPGRGWIMVRAGELSGDALVRAMMAGHFYSSTGVTLEDVRTEGRTLSIRVAPEPEAVYTIRFIGSRVGGEEIGVILKEVKGIRASYAFAGNELYVRAVVISDRPPADPVREGELQTAWVQPVSGLGGAGK